MANARIRRSRRRRTVNRGDRVSPTPETLAKLRPWTLRELLVAGPENGGIDADQFEAAALIVEAFRELTRHLGFKPLNLDRISPGSTDMSPKAERLASIYLAWGQSLQDWCHTSPHAVVEWIEDERTINLGDVPLLRRSLNLWDRCREVHDRERRAQRRTPQIVASGH